MKDNRSHAVQMRGRKKYVDILRHDPCSFCGNRNLSKSKKTVFLQTIDHIVAKAFGGSNTWMNLTSACKTCNGRKGRLSLLEFLLKRHKGDPQIISTHLQDPDEMESLPANWWDPLGLYSEGALCTSG